MNDELMSNQLWFSEAAPVSPEAWKRLTAGQSTSTRTFPARGRGKSWLWAILALRRELAPLTPEQEMREAVLWALQDAQKQNISQTKGFPWLPTGT